MSERQKHGLLLCAALQDPAGGVSADAKVNSARAEAASVAALMVRAAEPSLQGQLLLALLRALSAEKSEETRRALERGFMDALRVALRPASAFAPASSTLRGVMGDLFPDACLRALLGREDLASLAAALRAAAAMLQAGLRPALGTTVRSLTFYASSALQSFEEEEAAAGRALLTALLATPLPRSLSGIVIHSSLQPEYEDPENDLQDPRGEAQLGLAIRRLKGLWEIQTARSLCLEQSQPGLGWSPATASRMRLSSELSLKLPSTLLEQQRHLMSLRSEAGSEVWRCLRRLLKRQREEGLASELGEVPQQCWDSVRQGGHRADLLPAELFVECLRFRRELAVGAKRQRREPGRPAAGEVVCPTVAEVNQLLATWSSTASACGLIALGDLILETSLAHGEPELLETWGHWLHSLQDSRLPKTGLKRWCRWLRSRFLGITKQLLRSASPALNKRLLDLALPVSSPPASRYLKLFHFMLLRAAADVSPEAVASVFQQRSADGGWPVLEFASSWRALFRTCGVSPAWCQELGKQLQVAVQASFEEKPSYSLAVLAAEQGLRAEARQVLQASKEGWRGTRSLTQLLHLLSPKDCIIRGSPTLLQQILSLYKALASLSAQAQGGVADLALAEELRALSEDFKQLALQPLAASSRSALGCAAALAELLSRCLEELPAEKLNSLLHDLRLYWQRASPLTAPDIVPLLQLSSTILSQGPTLVAQLPLPRVAFGRLKGLRVHLTTKLLRSPAAIWVLHVVGEVVGLDHRTKARVRKAWRQTRLVLAAKESQEECNWTFPKRCSGPRKEQVLSFDAHVPLCADMLGMLTLKAQLLAETGALVARAEVEIEVHPPAN